MKIYHSKNFHLEVEEATKRINECRNSKNHGFLGFRIGLKKIIKPFSQKSTMLMVF